MDARNLLSLAGVLLVIGAAGWYWGMGQQPVVAERDERRPDYVITGIEALETNEKGQVSRRLQAPEVRHYSRPTDEAEIDTPVFTLYDDRHEAWRITSRQGRSLSRNTEIRLEGNVRAERRDPSAVPVTLNTEQLQVFPKEERLMSQQLVTVQSPQGHLQSQGIKANLKTGELVLTKNVQGNYAPTSR